MVLISTSKVFKDNKIARTRSTLWKVYKSAYLHQIAPEIMLLLVNNLLEKSTTKSQDGRNFGSARYLQFAIVLQLCTRVT